MTKRTITIGARLKDCGRRDNVERSQKLTTEQEQSKCSQKEQKVEVRNAIRLLILEGEIYQDENGRNYGRNDEHFKKSKHISCVSNG